MNPTRRIRARNSAAGSAQRRRDIELFGDRPPDLLGVLPVGQRLLHRPPAQLGQDMVLGDAARVGVAELRPHPLPELAEPHGPPLPSTLPAGEATGGRAANPTSELIRSKSEVCEQPGG